MNDWFRLIFYTGVCLFGPHFDLYQSLYEALLAEAAWCDPPSFL